MIVGYLSRVWNAKTPAWSSGLQTKGRWEVTFANGRVVRWDYKEDAEMIGGPSEQHIATGR